MNEPNYFGELLAILSDEELIRFQRRFEMRHNARMAEILGDELSERRDEQPLPET